MSKKIFEPVNSRHNDSCKHTFEDSVIEETWREVALAQLTTLIDLTFLDGVLAQDKPSKRQQQHHNLIISNIVAKNWHLPVTQSLFNLDTVGLGEEEDSVIQKAIACMECLPKGRHCPPGRFFDLHMAILNLILQRHNRQALEALRLDMVLLPLPVSIKLYHMKTGQNLPDIDTTFCDRVSREEYQRQARDCTQDALISLMNNVLDDTKVPLKEKKHRLKQFQKCYPTLYEEHFSGMV
nr:hypothetical protein BaRGS_004765 [Batillaria attramentaria]